MSSPLRRPPLAIIAAAAFFALTTAAWSWWRWWTFQYATFDLAFYVQGLWLALRGVWNVSLLHVPLLGNHAEPIVFLAAPLFAVFPHPMLLVVLQSLALASMPFTAWRIAQRVGIEGGAAQLLALTTLLTPATGFVALHEFHPEAFAAPLLLLLIEAKLAERLGRFWLWFLATLACKENLALLLVAFCAVHALIERRRSVRWQLRWNLLPLLIAAGWFAIYSKLIAPALNAGNVDYLELYSHLGASAGEIVRTFFVAPQRVLDALGTALVSGDLVWALIGPMLLLPLLRPRWLAIALPLLMQHLLSWRRSEWTVHFHYAAPLVPLVWIAAAEALQRLRHQRVIAIGVAAACVGAQLWIGPLSDLAPEIRSAPDRLAERKWRAEELRKIPADASVTAPLPFLPHLAKRRQLISLHHISKGLKTLSREEFPAPAMTDFVIADWADDATLDFRAGYYHPVLKGSDGRVVRASDELLHEFLRQEPMRSTTRNSVSLFTRGKDEAPELPTRDFHVAVGTQLAGMSIETGETVELQFRWEIDPARKAFPWVMLVGLNDQARWSVVKGPAAIAAAGDRSVECWSVELPRGVAAGKYQLTLVFYDFAAASQNQQLPPLSSRYVYSILPLGVFDLGSKR